jgi:hypothetical protein
MIERDPLRFWQTVAAILALLLLAWLPSKRAGRLLAVVLANVQNGGRPVRRTTASRATFRDRQQRTTARARLAETHTDIS